MKVSILHPTNKVNFSEVTVGPVTIWFSYETPIAFQSDGGFSIRENEWGPTTGKHLNLTDPDEGLRISGAEFEAELDSVCGRIH